ncbi:MAG: hypothetical protein E7100_02875 [Bacteroidaceae bacterium]|nr:hypothetical protein [Bacteroidaceae bacterium]
MILEDLFTDLATFRRYAPYVESNVDFKHLNSSAITARKQIVIILTNDVFAYVASKTNTEKEALLSAMANLTLAKQMVFDVISQRKNDIDIYKHEQEQMRRAYIDNYFNAMDTLLQLLADDNGSGWSGTRYQKMVSTLKLKNAADFDAVYPIDLSYLFFFRTIPLQAEALDDYLKGYYDRASGREDIIPMLNRVLAKITVAIALRRFDIIEFPPTIRSLFDDSKAQRTGRDEQQRMLELSDSLMNEAKSLLADIDLMLSAESGSIETETSFNRQDDKIILMA